MYLYKLEVPAFTDAATASQPERHSRERKARRRHWVHQVPDTPCHPSAARALGRAPRDGEGERNPVLPGALAGLLEVYVDQRVSRLSQDCQGEKEVTHRQQATGPV